MSLKFFFKNLYKSFYRAVIDLIRHDGIEHAGYLAFLIMLCIFPFLFFLMAIVTTIGSVEIFESIINSTIDGRAQAFLKVLQPGIYEIMQAPPKSLMTFTILSAVWTASSLFEGIRTILNKANRVETPPSYVFRRLISIVEFIVIIFITIGIIFLLWIVPVLWQMAKMQLYFEVPFLQQDIGLLREIAIIFFAYIFLSFLYYFLPNKKQSFITTIPGTISTIISWIIFSNLFNDYIKTFSQLSIIYGSIAGIIISLLFFYFCSVIFIFGAELNYNIQNSFRNKNE